MGQEREARRFLWIEIISDLSNDTNRLGGGGSFLQGFIQHTHWPYSTVPPFHYIQSHPHLGQRARGYVTVVIQTALSQWSKSRTDHCRPLWQGRLGTNMSAKAIRNVPRSHPWLVLGRSPPWSRDLGELGNYTLGQITSHSTRLNESVSSD